VKTAHSQTYKHCSLQGNSTESKGKICHLTFVGSNDLIQTQQAQNVQSTQKKKKKKKLQQLAHKFQCCIHEKKKN